MKKIKASLAAVGTVVAVNHALAGGNLETARKLLMTLDRRWQRIAAKWALWRYERRLNWAASDIDRWSRRPRTVMVPGTVVPGNA